ncbi:sensor histidine kinase [Phytopseudomonas punonensis]|uniref:histidine kinase n=1 Tax=Phytopseudomonas punonensis TaxID=1220495 RepID=A0A1M6YB21_9GAMM|nr:sensor histidine kinase [Pseudomonas punonensis]SHL15461.1 Signal transduction histidine kinase [Pseudomonas punonensis]
MRLSIFIDENIESILQSWEDFARTIKTPGKALDAEELRDHAGHMLRAITQDLNTSQTKQQQRDKSRGLDLDNSEQTAAETHAVTRLMAGFTLDQMVSEYRALRASVLSLWMGQIKSGSDFEIEDMTRFNEAIDQALAESIAGYSRAVEAARIIFLGILGHDLRNPLGAILLGADVLLRKENLGDKPAKIIEQISSSAHRANQIVGDLLDFTRTQLGPALPIRRGKSDLASVCKRIVDETRAAHPNSTIICEVPASEIGMFDESRMEQVFSNLISNAVQHGDAESPITVSLSSRSGECTIRVHNWGTPIADDVMPFIFNPMGRFSQHAMDDQGPCAGMGLGLYIASQIVTAHGGEIEVTSTAQKGTTFEVRLPA